MFVAQVFDAVLAYANALQRLYEVDLINEVNDSNKFFWENIRLLSSMSLRLTILPTAILSVLFMYLLITFLENKSYGTS